jgi:flagellar capping protein FliD
MAKKKSTFGINTYVKTTKKKIGRHKKRLSKSEKRSYKKYNRQGK